MVTGAHELTEEIARTFHGELSRRGLLPENEAEAWDQLSNRTRDRWIHVSTAAFLSLSRARAARGYSRPQYMLGAALSPRERVILDALSDMSTIRQIAMREYISPNTVKTHIRSIYRKLGISSRAEAVVAARALELSEQARSSAIPLDKFATPDEGHPVR